MLRFYFTWPGLPKIDVDGEHVFITDAGIRLDINWADFPEEFKKSFREKWDTLKRESDHPFRLCVLEKMVELINSGRISPETIFEDAYFAAVDAVWEEDIYPNKKVS